SERWELTMSGGFAANSPARRYFVGTEPVSWCQVGSQLWRYSQYAMQGTQPSGGFGVGSLMAEGLQNSSAQPAFTVNGATRQRDGLVQIQWRFARPEAGAERLVIQHEVAISNVP